MAPAGEMASMEWGVTVAVVITVGHPSAEGLHELLWWLEQGVPSKAVASATVQKGWDCDLL